ncbi:hypothetical protein EVAR_42913_1 [Eumeta japonica]|uniref:Uncharacterized protein n=1 Tax=Eumeta variegata TaxID=151549 RepID=A0A4C1WUZ4_EUMVA|nr:hypothetical protein EVAR_42913_1 [Eumeta japonica]
MTYASPVFAHARPVRLYDLQIVQNKFYRRAVDAPCPKCLGTTCEHRPPHKTCKPATSVFKELKRRKTKYNKRNDRLRHRVSTRRSLASYNRLAFQYDPTANYSDDENLDIGRMTTICRYCNALKFKEKRLDCAAQVEKSNWIHYLHHHSH